MRKVSESNFAQLCEYYDSKKSQDLSFVPPYLCRTPKDAAEYLKEHAITTILFDCDGVVYRSPAPAPNASRCLQTLIESNCKIFFVTNNSASNPKQLLAKLTAILGLDEKVLTANMMISTAWTAAQYLKQQLLDNDSKNNQSTVDPPRAYVIGSEGLKEEIRHTGITVVNTPDTENAEMSRDALADFDFAALGKIDAVVVGHDTAFSFRKLAIANVLLQHHPQALWIATNKDAFDLVGADGRALPGNGALVSALEFSSGRTAINVGKPSAHLIQLLQSVHGIDPKGGTLFVGDRLDTDIKFALDTGMHAALVMTGVTTASKLAELENGTIEEPAPTLVLPHIGYFAQ
jgi:phosphoglycolate/pyridoxal phosphate phosphatase family enzyme